MIGVGEIREGIKLHKRLQAVVVILSFLFGIIFLKLGYLQILHSETYRRSSEENRIRVIPIPPNRGRIYDRNGNLLVRNRVSYTVALDVSLAGDLDSTLKRLRNYVDFDIRATNEKIERLRKRGLLNEPVRIKEDIDYPNTDFPTVQKIEENLSEMPGVIVIREPRREYIYGNLAAHVLGYVREISEDEYSKLKSEGYKLGDLIGKEGVERVYEGRLRGKWGKKYVYVDARGNVIQEVMGEEDLPRSGDDLVLTIDKDIQRIAENAIRDFPGAVIVADPDTGEILAMVSKPDFDPNIFVRGITVEEWEALRDNPSYPLLNKAIQGRYPTGSIFKIVTATAGLQEGVINTQTRIHDPGYIETGDKKRPYLYCWYRGGHGDLNLRQAIKYSCNVFFYTVGRDLGVDKLIRMAREYGFGSITGIDLDGEDPGLLPTPEWKKRTYNEEWYSGNTMMLAIGQYALLATPIQALGMVEVIANGGTLYQPHVLKRSIDADGRVMEVKPRKVRQIRFEKEHLRAIRSGMWGVVNDAGFGTGRTAYTSAVEMAGKTGTAQNERSYKEENKEHGWFIAYAPYDKPKYAVVVITEYTGAWGAASASTVRRVMEGLFGKSGATQSNVNKTDAR
ncbi:MAG: penicillin-binding protein 2 [bacterium]